MIVAAYFLCNAAVIDVNNVYRSLTTNEYALVTILLIGTLVVASFVDRKYNRYKTNILFLLLLFVLGICSFVSLVYNPDTMIIATEWGDDVLTFTLDEKAYYFLFSIVTFILFYLFMYVLPRHFIYQKQFDLIIIFGFILLAAFIIYSYVAEWRNYLDFFFNLSSDDPYALTVKSLFDHRNNYGFLLFVFILASLYMHHVRPKSYWYIITFFLYANMIFTLCKTTLLLGGIVIILYLLARFFITYKEHKKRNVITISIVASLFLILAITVALSFFIPGGLFLFINKAVTRLFGGAFDTFNSRLAIWGDVMLILNSNLVYMFFGAGYGVFNNLLLSYTTLDPLAENNSFPHNGYLQLMGDGGVILLIVFIFAIAYLYYVMGKMFKKEKSLVALSFLMLTSSLIYMLFESAPLLFAKTPDMIFLSFLVTVPLLSRYYQYNHPLVRKEIILQKEKVERPKLEIYAEKFSLAKTIYFIFTPIVATFVGSTFFLINQYGFNEITIWSIFGAIVAIYLCLPLLVQFIYNLATKKNKIDYKYYFADVWVFYVVTFLLVSGIVAAFYYFVSDYTTLLLVLPYFVVSILFYYLLTAVPGFRVFTNTDNMIDRLNIFWLNHLYLAIQSDPMSQHETPHGTDYEIEREEILLISSDDLYRSNLKAALENKGYHVVVYDELINNFIHKVNNIMPWRANLESSRTFIDDILYDSLLKKYSYIIVTMGRGITIDMINDLRYYQSDAKFIYYIPYKMSKYPYSKFLCRSFDQCYSIYKIDSFNEKINLLSSYYLDDILKYIDVEATDDFTCICSGKKNDLPILKKTLDDFYSKYTRGNIIIKLPLKKREKFLKEINKTLGKYTDKITYVPSFFNETVFRSIARAKYFVDVSSSDNISNIDFVNIYLLKKKIITNNTLAKTFQYYSANNIYIFFKEDHIDFAGDFFMDSNYDDYSRVILENNSKEKFIEKLLS